LLLRYTNDTLGKNGKLMRIPVLLALISTLLLSACAELPYPKRMTRSPWYDDVNPVNENSDWDLLEGDEKSYGRDTTLSEMGHSAVQLLE
jgi:hypothetical protein